VQLIVILSKRSVRREELALSEVEGIWASRAMRRVLCDATNARSARFLAKLLHYPIVPSLANFSHPIAN
jgi:hypothetical protein